MNYWLFQGNPKYYRFLDAIKELEEMPWLVTRYTQEINVGDGVLVWMSGENAGIYAVAEIIESPQVLTELPHSEYWIEKSRFREDKPHVKIRFIRKLIGQPLRRFELKYDRILKNLLVIRVPNSTNFKVTPEEWERVYELKG
jgi:predicted RNA-binding protein with PUA-like domain